jgi:acylphosphatase
MEVRLNIRGRVQGVFFRESTRRQALALSVRGWVKNLPDGSVEAVAQGSPEAVESFIAWCHHGPASAQVEEVVVQQVPSETSLVGFEVVR